MSDIGVLNEFVSGTRILSDPVNSNFTNIRTAVNSKQDRDTTALESEIPIFDGDGNTVTSGKLFSTSVAQEDSAVDTKVPTEKAVRTAMNSFVESFSGNITYTVSSGNVDSNGYADIIQKDTDVKVSFKVDDGTLYAPIKINYCDNTIEELETLTEIDGLDNDGTYIIIKEKGLDPKAIYISGAPIHPVMYSNTSPTGYEASASSVDSSTYAAWKAFNGTNSSSTDGWRSGSAPSSGTPQTLTIEIPSAKTATFYKLTSRNSSTVEGPVDWTIKGSNDGTSWTTLHTVTGASWTQNQTRTYTLSSPGSYSHYRFSCTSSGSGGGTYVGVGELQFYQESDLNTVTESFTEPSSPILGDYWVNLSTKPYKPYLYDGASWVETQFVKLGQVTKVSGTLGTPISYTFNGLYINDLAVVTSTTYTVNHNIGTTFILIHGVIAGDNVNIPGSRDDSTTRGITTTAITNTTVNIATGANLRPSSSNVLSSGTERLIIRRAF